MMASSSFGAGSSGDGGDSGSSSSGGAGGMSVEDQMRDEIARLTATINEHKSTQTSSYNKPPSYGTHMPYGGYGGNVYYGGYRGRGGRGRGSWTATGATGPHKQYVRPGLATAPSAGSAKGKENAVAKVVEGGSTSAEEGGEAGKAKGRKEVIIGGIAFEASKRSLVRKDLAKKKPKSKRATPHASSTPFMRKGSHLPPRSRVYKPKGRNMTLDNTGRMYNQSKKSTIRKIDKPCTRFTKTGTCPRGLTCPYQHDPTKIALCWNYMQGNCPNTADTCNLSHNPTPERTPLCVHFLNRGRCTKEKCLFPHVNLGKKEGVCKDFAVLGYCSKGLECDKNHVRECPEFEETGECRTKGCKLPHVIKANARWAKKDTEPSKKVEEEKVTTVESGQLGDEYISLIFNESESEEEDESEEMEEEEEEEEEVEEVEDDGEMVIEVHG